MVDKVEQKDPNAWIKTLGFEEVSKEEVEDNSWAETLGLEAETEAAISDGSTRRPEMSPMERFQKYGDPGEFNSPPVAPTEQPSSGAEELQRRVGSPVDTLKKVGNALYSGVRNTAETALALGDTIMSPIVGRELKSAQQFDEFMPEAAKPDDNFVDQMVHTGIEAVPGLIGGGRAVAAITPVAKSLIGKFGRYLAVGTGSEAGGAISMDPDTEKWLFGPEGVTGLGFDEKGTYNEQLFEKKLNLLGDSLAVGGIVGTAGAGIGQGFKFLFGTNGVINNISKLKNAPKQEREIVRNFLDIVSDVDPSDTAEIIASKRQKAIDYVKSNKDVLIKFMDTDGNEVTESYVTDVVSALKRNLDPKKDGAQIALLEGLESSITNAKTPNLRAAENRPNIALEGTTEKTIANRGGSENIPAARDTIVEQAQESVDAATDAVFSKQLEIGMMEKDIDDAIRMDPMFGQMVDNLDGKVRIGLAADLKEAKGRELTEKLFRANDLMTEEKNRLYALIPDTAEIDQSSLASVFEEVGEFIPQSIKDQIEAAGTNFKQLNNLASTSIQREIDIARKLGTPEGLQKADALRALKDNIQDTQLDFLIETGDAATVDTALAARKYFREEFAPFWRDNPTLEKIDDLAKFERSPIKREEGAIQATDTMLNNPNRRPSIRNTEEVLAKDEAGRSGQLLSEYQTISKITPKVEAILNKKGKLTAEDVIGLSKDFGEYATTLQKGGERDRIETFLTTIRDKDFDVQRLKEELQGLEANLKSSHEIFDKNVGAFFDGKGESRTLKPSAYESFKTIFNDPQSVDKIRDYLKTTGKSPEARKGMEAAYLKWLKEDNFFKSGTSGGVRKVNVNKLDEFLKPDSPLGEYAKEILPPDTYEGLRIAVNEAYKKAASKESGAGLSVSTKELPANAQIGIQNVITWVWGVLNPTAARLRTVTGQFVRTNNPEDNMAKMLDVIMADPDKFIDVATKVAKMDKGRLTDAQKRILFKTMVKGGLYQDKDEEAFMTEEADIDASRPIIENADGSFSTERTITIEMDGEWINLPTIVDGKQRSEDEAIELMKQGKNKPVGKFSSLEEAETAAIERSTKIGKIREKDRK